MPPTHLPVGLSAPASKLRGWFDAWRRRPMSGEEVLRQALHAGGGQLWCYDLRNGQLWLYGDPGDSGRCGATVQLRLDGAFPRVHPEDLPRLQRAFIGHRDGDQPTFHSEHRIDLAGDGHWTWVDARGRIVERDGAGTPLRMAGIARSLPPGQLADTERSIAAEILHSMSEAVAVIDRQLCFVSVNAAFTRITGYDESQVLQRPLAMLDRPDEAAAEHRRLLDALERDGHWQGTAWKIRRDGEEILCSLRHNLVRDAGGQRIFHVLVMQDITEQTRAEQELRYLANYDTLTGLPNRALLGERLAQAVARAQERGSRLAVLFLDLDRFKDINDSMGHAVGDQVLRAAAERIRQVVGVRHIAARLSGDEFTVVLEDLADAGQAMPVAHQLLAGFEEPLRLDEGREVVMSPSIGISLFPDHADQPADLLKLADTAMYRAKATGRRTAQQYSPRMDEGTRQRALLASTLRRIRFQDELRLVYQPRYSLQQRRIVGFEALLRWDSPEFGPVPPDRFIPLAEESGLIVPIGEWALRQACLTLHDWRARGLDGLVVSVNVSAIQLEHGNLAATVARILLETGVPAAQLELELTESVVMANVLGNADTLRALRRLGVGLAIDDFGTGYSSLAYLKRLPIDTLKIDQEFVADLTRDPDDEAITSTIIAMGHSLALKVVAEGVEDAGQLAFLRRHGCDEIQGYLVSPALDPAACVALLERAPSPDAALATMP